MIVNVNREEHFHWNGKQTAEVEEDALNYRIRYFCRWPILYSLEVTVLNKSKFDNAFNDFGYEIMRDRLVLVESAFLDEMS